MGRDGLLSSLDSAGAGTVGKLCLSPERNLNQGNSGVSISSTEDSGRARQISDTSRHFSSVHT